MIQTVFAAAGLIPVTWVMWMRMDFFISAEERKYNYISRSEYMPGGTGGVSSGYFPGIEEIRKLAGKAII